MNGRLVRILHALLALATAEVRVGSFVVVDFVVVFPRVLLHRSPGEGYQNMDSSAGYQNSSGGGGGADHEGWETFGSGSKPKKSPSSDSWTVADNSAGKKSSDSWDNWGSEGQQSNNKHSTGDSWETWDTNWESAGGSDNKAKKSPAKPVEESWDNADW